jgi:hypothetical protein
MKMLLCRGEDNYILNGRQNSIPAGDTFITQMKQGLLEVWWIDPWQDNFKTHHNFNVQMTFWRAKYVWEVLSIKEFMGSKFHIQISKLLYTRTLSLGPFRMIAY